MVELEKRVTSKHRTVSQSPWQWKNAKRLRPLLDQAKRENIIGYKVKIPARLVSVKEVYSKTSDMVKEDQSLSPLPSPPNQRLKSLEVSIPDKTSR